MRIQLLEPLIANQIAAGEVVERPASVVKELVENSIDANATQITVEIEIGGNELIRVIDNGQGIHSDDLLLALNRHATSKIRKLDDLMAIDSLGFRGEALASIASVSRLDLSSKHHQAETAWRVRTEGAEIQAKKPAAHPQGTTVEVRQIFFNTPGRRKFLKSEKTEFQHIQEIVKRLALSHFDIGFKLTHQGKIVFDLKPAHDQLSQEKRIAALLGDECVQNLIYIQYESAGMLLKGWIGLPIFSRSQPDMQYLYINGRFVRDKLISHAIKQAYQDVLYHGRYPVYLLSFDLNPKELDVNVHPAKEEVRFRQTQIVHQFFMHAIQQALAKIKPEDVQHQKIKVDSVFTAHETSVPWSVQEKSETYGAEKNAAADVLKSSDVNLYPSPMDFKKTVQIEPSMLDFQQNSEARTDCRGDSRIAYPNKSMPTDTHQDYPLGYALGQIQNIYILSQTKNGLVIVDMHAAHERILYEKLKKDYSQQKLIKQNLLIPIVVKLLTHEMTAFENYQTLFKDLGFDIQALGEKEIVIRAIPALLKEKNLEQLVRDVLADLSHHDTTSRIDEQLNAVLTCVACHSAVRAHDVLTLPEMNALLRDIENMPRTQQCGHGRPTWIELPVKELD